MRPPNSSRTFARSLPLLGALTALAGCNSSSPMSAGATTLPVMAGTGVQAVAAGAFVSSLGVDSHIAQGYSYINYIAGLQYTGIRNIRDGAGNIASEVALHQATGALVDMISECAFSNDLPAAQQLAAAGALLSIEGPNEPNNFPITYNGQAGGGTGTWLPVAQCQQALYSGVKASPALGQYPVFTVSEVGAEVDNVGLQFLTIPSGAGTTMPAGTRYADYANCHNYVIGNAGTYIDNQAWQAADYQPNSWPGDGLYGEFGGFTWLKHYAAYTIPQVQVLPRVTTETGWDSVNNPGGEPVQGKVLTNTYLAQFKRSWSYTFIYELVDGEGSTGNQGLYHSDHTPKLAATYLHNLTTILADPSTLANPGLLNYTIPNQPATVHDLLLQKSSGTFELVVWGEQVSGSNSVAVSLGATYGTVNVYDITSGTAPVQALSNVSAVSLSLSDHALVLEIH